MFRPFWGPDSLTIHIYSLTFGVEMECPDANMMGTPPLQLNVEPENEILQKTKKKLNHESCPIPSMGRT